VYEKIGKRIKELRLKAGYTAADKFAYENEIGRSQYAAWEAGQDMKISSLLRVLKSHNMNIEDFFGGMK
jgi:transcriptional regulator with XRE-family HTH domain